MSENFCFEIPRIQRVNCITELRNIVTPERTEISVSDREARDTRTVATALGTVRIISNEYHSLFLLFLNPSMNSSTRIHTEAR